MFIFKNNYYKINIYIFMEGNWEIREIKVKLFIIVLRWYLLVFCYGCVKFLFLVWLFYWLLEGKNFYGVLY